MLENHDDQELLTQLWADYSTLNPQAPQIHRAAGIPRRKSG